MRRHPSLRASIAAIVVLFCSAGAVAQRASTAQSDAIQIPFETYTLANGLTVVTSVDRATPTVAVNVWYHVGSKNETRGRTGFAHLFEHLMFTGSGHAPYGLHDKLTGGVGGSNNASTSKDRTRYFQAVPSNYLESTLWLEADRMGYFLDSLDLVKLNAQRDIVKNERRQGIDNQPYGRAQEILWHAIYPSSHPYSSVVAGSMADLTAATEEDVKSFFRLHYTPNNAFLVIVGDFDSAQARSWVQKYFGEFQRGKPVERPSVPPVTFGAERRLVYEDRVPIPQLYIQWPTVGETHEDRFALNVLGAILSGRRTARLTKALLYDKQSAVSIMALQSSSENAGEFGVTITPRPGNTLTDLERAADGVVDALKAEGPTAEEIQKAIADAELSFLGDLESNIGKTNRLAAGACFHGDAGYFRTEYQKGQTVTTADVRRVANKYLTKGRVVLSVVPIGKVDQASHPGESTKVTNEPVAGAEARR